MSRKQGRKLNRIVRRGGALLVAVWLVLASPTVVLAQAVDATGAPTGAPEQTGAPQCTGAGCGQGANQGVKQGAGQGGPSLKELGAVENENGELVLPEGVKDTRQGATQGKAQGSSNGSISGENTNTGAGSNNEIGVDAKATTTNSVTNKATDTTQANAAAKTGGNAQSSNTGSTSMKTGNAGIGVTQVKNDNTATIGGTVGLNSSGYKGTHNGDLQLGFGTTTAKLSGPSTGSGSIRAINDTTGSDSQNAVEIKTKTEELNEVQNDGKIDNLLDLVAITGQNEANKNTGDGTITTGNADIAATLVNLLNTTVINGAILLSVADIFGDLNGNIVLPELAKLAALFPVAAGLTIDAINEETGADSTNVIDIDVAEREETNINNKADVNTKVNARAITGQNDTLSNTGGGIVETGDASVTASNLTLANTTIEGGNWALVVVNALNRWLGFMVGENGEIRALSQDETIEAMNSGTGSDSSNTIDIETEKNRLTTVTNKAEINNEVNAAAITGQNQANKNTGQGKIATGDANVVATAINIANTTVKDGALFVAVVNIFGDWFGDLLYGGSSLLAGAARGGQIDVNGENSKTGSNSTNNTIDVDVTREKETNINNEAEVETILNAEVDTGSNRANRNTLGGGVKTGSGTLALHSRTLANIVGLSGDAPLGLTITGLNDTTGAESENTIRATVNDKRVTNVNNLAWVDNIFSVLGNTGANEANQNTLGGEIVTGRLNANVGINNLVNRVILALADGGFAAGEAINLDAEFINRLTGALSQNSNAADLNIDWLTNILNEGVVNNLVDLLLNTGRNTANENTGGGAFLSAAAVGGGITTGAGCVEGSVHNDLNRVTGGLGGSLAIGNNALVAGAFNIDVNTGGNETSGNTSLSVSADGGGNCEPKLALAPEEEPDKVGAPSTASSATTADKGSGQGGDDGGDVGPDESLRPAAAPEGRVASVLDEPRGRVANRLLKRFPVAGGENLAQLLPGEQRSLWPLFILLSTLLLAGAYNFDHVARERRGRQTI